MASIAGRSLCLKVRSPKNGYQMGVRYSASLSRPSCAIKSASDLGSFAVIEVEKSTKVAYAFGSAPLVCGGIDPGLIQLLAKPW